MKNLLFTLFILMLLAPARSHAQCNPDLTPPVAQCAGDVYRDVAPTGSITVHADDFNAGSYDGCDASNTLGYFIELAPQSSTPPSTTSLNFSASQAGDHTIVLWVVDQSGNAATCTSTLHVSQCTPALALACNDEVTVELGDDNTYLLDAFDILVGGPYCNYNIYQVRVDMSGFAQTQLLTADDLGPHQVSVSGTGAICWGTLIVVAGQQLNQDCAQLHVDMAATGLQPCADKTYKVFYGNGSTLAVPGAYVEVTLDPQLEFQNASLPATALGGNRFRFETGNLAPAASGWFDVNFRVVCDAIPGATHCSEARIFPKTTCTIPGTTWSGAEISVEGACVNDSIHMTIRNTGIADNIQNLEFVVVEDVLMLQDGTVSLPAGGALQLDPIPGTGHTYRLEVQQEPGHPYGGAPAVAIEGCGGFTPGMVVLFPTENTDPAIAVNCRENNSGNQSFDLQGFPAGLGQDHLIEKGAPLQYLIQFQNTGAETADRVVVSDTLSSLLDMSSLRIGAASHPYRFEINGQVLRITFDGIALPTQSASENGSQGFIQFSIRQQPNLAEGSQIRNIARIDVGYNPPVTTAATLHTVGTHFLGSVAVNDPAAGLPQLQVYPNPAHDVMIFQSRAGSAGRDLEFRLIDAMGRTRISNSGVNLPMKLERGNLPHGNYFFRFGDKTGRTLWSGVVTVN